MRRWAAAALMLVAVGTGSLAAQEATRAPAAAEASSAPPGGAAAAAASSVAAQSAAAVVSAAATGGSPSAAVSVPTVSLTDAIRAAASNGLSFKIAAETLRSSGQALQAARANAGLTLSGSGAYYHEDTLPGANAPITTPAALLTSDAAAQAAIGALSTNPTGENVTAGAVLSGPATNVTLSGQHLVESGDYDDSVSAITLSGKQTILDGYPGGRGAGTLRQAEYAYQRAQNSYASQRLSLTLQVKQDYYTVLGDQDAATAAQANVDAAREQLDRVQGFLEAGEATNLDVLQAQVAFDQAQLGLESAQNQTEIDRKTLSLAVGWSLDRMYRVEPADAPKPATLDPAQALGIAFANRAELKDLALALESAKVQLDLARSQYVPVVSATGKVSFEHDWTADYSMGTFSAGVSVSLPIFEGGLLSSQVAQAQSTLDQLSAQQSQERQSIEIAVQRAIFGVTHAQQAQAVAEKNMGAAEGEYTLEKEKLAAGLASNLDVIQALSALTQARTDYQSSKNAYDLAVLQLNDALGVSGGGS